jgi:hypothetical protein
VFDWLRDLIRTGLESLIPLFRNTDFAFSIAGAMVFAAALLVVLAIVRHAYTSAGLRAGVREISGFMVFDSGPKAGLAEPRERQFLERFAEIDRVFSRPGVGRSGLAEAWDRYRRTLILDQAPPIRATQSPSVFLFAAYSPPTWLGFAANLFIAFGLLATFLGLIAALTFATQGMTSSDAAATQLALRDLLASAASKFITSVAGVALSIILRLVERLLTVDLRQTIGALSRALEFGIRVDPNAHGAVLAAAMERLSARAEPSPDGAAGTRPS